MVFINPNKGGQRKAAALYLAGSKKEKSQCDIAYAVLHRDPLMLMPRSWKFNFQSLWQTVTYSGFKHKSSNSVYNAVRVNGSAHQMDCNVSYICQLTWDRTFSINIRKCQLPTKNRLPVSVGVCGSTFAGWMWLFGKKGVGVNLLTWFSICIAVTVRSQGCGCRNEGRKRWDMWWYSSTGFWQLHHSVLNDSRLKSSMTGLIWIWHQMGSNTP